MLSLLLLLLSAAVAALGAPSPDEHHHDVGVAPLLHINESQVLMYHSPTPPSYWSIDIDAPGTRYPALIALHAILFSLAFFVALPAAIALRSVSHALRPLALVAFYALSFLGCVSSALYRKLTPDMYEHQAHSSQGYLWLLFALALTAIDGAALLARIYTYLRHGDRSGFSHFCNIVLLGKQSHVPAASEYVGLVYADPDEYDDPVLTEEPKHIGDDSESSHRRSTHEQGQWDHRTLESRHSYRNSTASERTLFGTLPSPKGSHHSDETLNERVPAQSPRTLREWATAIGKGVFAVSERVLVFAGFMQVLTGITVYTGGCRENYINGCLAHLIKGGIFWCYGLASFARFLGGFSEIGWAWNRSPHGDRYPSAEFVESLVIFAYGATNTWMERWGANPGDPFTTKQVQHISIAVMFWFAGLLGMGIESRVVRQWLAASAKASAGRVADADAESEPPSYRGSFNPFPALVIGVTGAAMSAHAQTYLFQVQIHSLWGGLLLAFAALRCATYFFLWLSPPRSVLPSRPPTEALGSFFLACGGLMFIFSTEEITLAAMRRGRDDMMMFLNLAVAITCFACCWVFAIVAFRGWLKSRAAARSARAGSPAHA